MSQNYLATEAVFVNVEGFNLVHTARLEIKDAVLTRFSGYAQISLIYIIHYLLTCEMGLMCPGNLMEQCKAPLVHFRKNYSLVGGKCTSSNLQHICAETMPKNYTN